MKHTPLFALALSTGLLVVTIFATAAPSGQGTGQPPAGKAEDPAAGLFTRMCNECHDADRIVSPRRTKADWEDILSKMIDKGAAGSEKEFETVFEYLLRTYGVADINRAPADEIAAVLTLTAKDAEAIVAFRKANGAFKDLEALKKVPNIDVKALDEHKAAIVF
jgi:competence ComEA-like helix-hairpin-helix protein